MRSRVHGRGDRCGVSSAQERKNKRQNARRDEATEAEASFHRHSESGDSKEMSSEAETLVGRA